MLYHECGRGTDRNCARQWRIGDVWNKNGGGQCIGILEKCFGWQVRPSGRRCGGRRGVNAPEAVGVIEPASGAVLRPTRIAGIVSRGGVNQDLLHVAPAEVGIGVEDQRDEARGQRRRRGRAAEIKSIITIIISRITCSIGCRNATSRKAGRCIDEHRRAEFAVIGDEAITPRGAHGNRVAAIGVAIGIDVVVILPAVSGCPGINDPLTAAADCRAVLQRGLGQRAWPLDSLRVV